MEEAANLGQRIQDERDSAQVSLFGTAEIVKNNGNGHGSIPDIREWDEKLRLNFEKEALGFYITGHPLGRYQAEMKRFSSHDTVGLSELSDKAEVKVCGVVSALKEYITKKGERMGFITMEDLVGSVEVVVLPNIYQEVAEFLKSDEPLLVGGSFEKGEKSNKIIASSVQPLRAVSERETTSVSFTLKDVDAGRLESLKEIMVRYHGGCQARLLIELPDLCTAVVRLPKECYVTPTEGLAVEVEDLLGYNAVSFE
jgi:DNA polymerase-3 subunit alpha